MITQAPIVLEVPRARNSKAKIQVIARAAAVLRILEDEREGLSLGAIAQRLKLPRSTIQRIVGALEAENLVIAASPNGGVKLGPALLRLSSCVETSAAEIVKPFMTQLAAEFGETVDLSVMGRNHAMFVDQAVGSQRIYAISAIAEKYQLHCTANGKAMLAMMTDVEVEQKIGASYEKYTDNTRTNISMLVKDLHVIRRTGVAYDMQEYAMGVSAISVGFRDALGNRMALSVPMPTPRFNELRDKVAQRLLEVREILTRRLGGRQAA